MTCHKIEIKQLKNILPYLFASSYLHPKAQKFVRHYIIGELSRRSVAWTTYRETAGWVWKWVEFSSGPITLNCSSSSSCGSFFPAGCWMW